MVGLLAITVLIEAAGAAPLAWLSDLPQQVERSLTALAEPCRQLGQVLASRQRLFFLGGGPSFGIAQYGAAKLWEAGGLLGLACEIEEFAHGAHLLIEPGDHLILLAPSGPSLAWADELVPGLARLGAAASLVTDRPAVAAAAASVLPLPPWPEPWAPLLQPLPLQWLVLALATARGRDLATKSDRALPASLYDLVQRQWLG
jgi:glucosamine--fructose-6-phosphate aminotransferase (isomerizing)